MSDMVVSVEPLIVNTVPFGMNTFSVPCSLISDTRTPIEHFAGIGLRTL